MQTDRATKPQPPYDRNLPPEYWEELKTPDRRPRTQPPRKPIKGIKAPILRTAVVLLAMLCIAFLAGRRPSLPKPEPVAAATPAPALALSPTPSPVPVQSAPRALPVAGPLTSVGTPMLSGSQYYVAMPDGRQLLINYKGWVDHACNLPRQPKGGADNAAYTEAATGYTWIWTVPIDSNVPKWLDP